MTFIYCMPRPGDPRDKDVLERCDFLSEPGLVQAGVNIAADLVIFIVPLPIILRLKHDRSKKIALAVIFGVGFM